MYKSLIASAIDIIEKAKEKKQEKKPEEIQQMEILIFGQPVGELDRKEKEKRKQKIQLQKNFFCALMRHNRGERNWTNKYKGK